jgi:hypothetical protein
MFALLRRRRDRIALIAALLVPVAVCAGLIPARTTLANTDAALALVALVVAVAALGNRLGGYLAAAGAAVWFDFFLTMPYERLTITRHTDAHRPLRCCWSWGSRPPNSPSRPAAVPGWWKWTRLCWRWCSPRRGWWRAVRTPAASSPR